jgi:Tol biopolymer transport system component
VTAKLYLPDAEKGYYRGTRFEWSGQIRSLQAQGHEYFGVWFPRYDPKLHDAITGPVEEFVTDAGEPGYAEAKPGGKFLRYGVGICRKPDDRPYNRFRTYEIVDPGQWKVKQGSDWIEFKHTLSDGAGIAYEYTKKIRLVKGKSEMLIEHTLKNKGSKRIETAQYNHNFFVIDGKPTGPSASVRFAFEPKAKEDFRGLAELRGNELVYLKELAGGGQSAFSELTGYGDTAAHNDVRVEHRGAGAGVRVSVDQPITRFIFWSIRTTICPETYAKVAADPGKSAKWTSRYEFYTLPGAQSKGPLFDRPGDVGAVVEAGKSEWDRNGAWYRVTGAGENMWFAKDAFHMLSKEVEGDVSISADFDWLTAGGHEHKKAGVILRADRTPDAPYADMIAHGDGTLSMQYRKVRGGPTLEVKTALRAPATLRIARHGDVVSAEVAPKGGTFQPIGALSIPMGAKIEAGLAVCSHEPNAKQTANFTNVALAEDGAVDEKRRVVESTLEVMDVDTGARTIVYRAKKHFEAPNWSKDGHLYFNGGGALWRVPAIGGEPVRIDTDGVRINNDHGISPDGQWMAISGNKGDGGSQIFVIPVNGGAARLVSPVKPSYWHGWSPDGKTHVFCAERNKNYDVYSIPSDGGAETRLTTADGLDDGPEYSPDGGFVYFNSVRSGVMQIWRMKPDGSAQEKISQGEVTADWFAHPSPDGARIVYIAYEKSVEGHPPNKEVVLKMAAMDGSNPKIIATLFGGQGTINVPSWSPDSKKIAFVSYRLVKPD